jgi:hypothetical protein
MSGIAENKFHFVILLTKVHCQAIKHGSFFFLTFERLKYKLLRWLDMKVPRLKGLLFFSCQDLSCWIPAAILNTLSCNNGSGSVALLICVFQMNPQLITPLPYNRYNNRCMSLFSFHLSFLYSFLASSDFLLTNVYSHLQYLTLSFVLVSSRTHS